MEKVKERKGEELHMFLKERSGSARQQSLVSHNTRTKLTDSQPPLSRLSPVQVYRFPHALFAMLPRKPPHFPNSLAGSAGKTTPHSLLGLFPSN